MEIVVLKYIWALAVIEAIEPGFEGRGGSFLAKEVPG